MSSSIENPLKSIDQNIKVHDRVASTYDAKHVEIYNPKEQGRIKSILKMAISLIRTDALRPSILDFGSGTGNLTKHLLDLQANVTAGDVSPISLEILKNKFNDSKYLKTIILNGENLSKFAEDTFDMVATYSVLHHVPNYLDIIDEFVRVTKPGGVIYIDHEVCPSYWEEKIEYLNYLNELGEDFLNIYFLEMGKDDMNLLQGLDRLSKKDGSFLRKGMLIVGKILGSLKVRNFLPLSGEGDIHTSKNDHVEWHIIKERLTTDCRIIFEKDYLVCRETDHNPVVWQKWENKCVDMRLIVVQKKDEC